MKISLFAEVRGKLREELDVLSIRRHKNTIFWDVEIERLGKIERHLMHESGLDRWCPSWKRLASQSKENK